MKELVKNMTQSTISKLKMFPRHAIYPAILLFLLIVGTITAISGSSIGMYHLILGKGEDSSLIVGEPRGIRGDEWQLITSKTIAQSFNGYKPFNPNIGVSGENVSLRPDVPTKDINTIFRPQNWAFLILPLDNAIAYKWWFFTTFVLISAYYFVRRFFTKNIFVAILLGGFLVFASLPQWTYREFIFLVLGFGFVGVILADWLQTRLLELRKTNLKRQTRNYVMKTLVGTLAVAYSVVAYMLVLYPPMQISVGLVLLAFYLDIVLKRKRHYKSNIWMTLRAQKLLGLAIIMAVAISASLFLQQKETILAIKNTEHPGVRHFESGWSAEAPGRLSNLIIGGSTPLLLQKDTALRESDYFAKTATGNQSEASNYPWIIPFIVVALTYGAIQSRRKLLLPWFTLGASVFVVGWMLISDMSLPIIDQVHPNRWNLSIGLLSFLLLGFAIQATRQVREFDKSIGKYVYYAIGFALVLINLGFFISLNNSFPALVSKIDAIIFILMAVIGPILILLRRYLWALLAIVPIAMAVNMNVNPLYQGTKAARDSNIVRAISKVNEADTNPGRWVMAMNVVSFEHLPLLAGAKSFTTHFSYPQKFWRILDPTNEGNHVYNRAAHIKVDLTDKDSEVYLKSTNTIGVHLNPCDKRTKDLGIEYVVTYSHREAKGIECLDLVTSAEGAGTTIFNIYRIKPLAKTNYLNL